MKLRAADSLYLHATHTQTRICTSQNYWRLWKELENNQHFYRTSSPGCSVKEPFENNSYINQNVMVFSWVGFLRHGSYNAVFWISDESSGDNTLMFPLLQSSAYTELLCFSHCSASKELGSAQPGQLTQADQSHVASCSAVKAGRMEEEKKMYGVMAFIFPRNC